MVTASVVVPTFRRTASLRRTLGSCLRQCGIDPAAFEIVVVDNCPGGSARETVAAAAAGTPVAIRYVHEPRPGVSHARNAGVAAARRSEAHTSELQSLMSTSYAVFCLKKNTHPDTHHIPLRLTT